jgi:hypothetical protein
MSRLALTALLCAALLGACSGSDDDNGSATEPEAGATTSAPGGSDGQRFPDVVDAQVVERTGDTYAFTVTISSPYDTPERYADGWRITGPDGTVYGEHELAHDHAAEQPFTRTQSGVRIPEGVDEVVVEGRDLANGYGGETVTVTLGDR